MAACAGMVPIAQINQANRRRSKRWMLAATGVTLERQPATTP